MNDRESNLMFYETLGTIFWLLVDFCWIMEFKALLAIFTIPAIISLSLVFKYTEKSVTIFAANVAMLSWLFMSILWAIGDLWSVPGAVILAKWTISFSLILLVIFLIAGDFRREAVDRFRRFRVPRD